jgi:hypothetical protein
MPTLSFKEYYDSKQKLLSACESIPRIRSEYRITKYCKFPFFESLSSENREYIAFKPKDRIEVLWEKVDEYDAYPVAKRITLITEGRKEVFPIWNNKKMHSWIDTNTNEM